jgi:hypothetical protein
VNRAPGLPDDLHDLLVKLLLHRVQHLYVKPLLVRVRDEPVGQHSRHLVSPQVHQHLLRIDHSVDGANHAHPDAAEVAQVENVVELGRRRQHFRLRDEPEFSCERHQTLCEGADRFREASRLAVVAARHRRKDLGRNSPIVKHYSSIKNSCFVTCVNSALCS